MLVDIPAKVVPNKDLEIVSADPKGAVLGSDVFGSVAFVPILRAKWKPNTHGRVK